MAKVRGRVRRAEARVKRMVRCLPNHLTGGKTKAMRVADHLPNHLVSRTKTTGHLMRHPATREWLARHPEFPVDAWCRGIARSYDHPQHGRIRIAVEQDPLEVLRLGTHVASCLAP